MFKKKWYQLTAIMLVIMLAVPGLAFADDNKDFSLTASKNQVSAGEQFTFTATANVSDLYAFETVFEFDKARLKFVRASSHLKGYEVKPAVTDNKIVFAHTKLGDVSGYNGEVVLCTMTFEAITAGDTEVNWVRLLTLNSALEETSRTAVESASVKVINNAGGGTGGGSNPDPDPDLDHEEGTHIVVEPVLTGGKARSEVSQARLEQAFGQAVPDAKGIRKIVIEMKVAAGAEAYVQAMPAQLFTSGDGKKVVEIRSTFATVTLPDNMLKANDTAGAAQIEIMIGAADTSGFNDELKRKIGSKPVIELSVFVDGKPLKWNNKQAPVTVSIAYQPTSEELKKPEHIAIWYIDGKGQVKKIPSGKYDSLTGKVIFTTTHFSQFATAYEIKTFQDLIDNHWAKEQVEILVSKGIVYGTSANAYSPDSVITRADFITLLVRALSLETEFKEQFDDVHPSDYYSEAVGVAKKLGVIQGVGGNAFEPKRPITRQDMMVMTVRAMSAAGKAPVHGDIEDLIAYSDANNLSKYAIDSAADLVNSRIMVGYNGRLEPKALTSRAETAVLIYRIY